MADIVLRVRMLSGDQKDVVYDGSATDDEAVVDEVIAALAPEGGVLRCRHGGRSLALFGRGVASVELAPRGAVL